MCLNWLFFLSGRGFGGVAAEGRGGQAVVVGLNWRFFDLNLGVFEFFHLNVFELAFFLNV